MSFPLLFFSHLFQRVSPLSGSSNTPFHTCSIRPRIDMAQTRPRTSLATTFVRFGRRAEAVSETRTSRANISRARTIHKTENRYLSRVVTRFADTTSSSSQRSHTSSSTRPEQRRSSTVASASYLLSIVIDIDWVTRFSVINCQSIRSPLFSFTSI